jgi:hypothetical protein
VLDRAKVVKDGEVVEVQLHENVEGSFRSSLVC